MLRAPLGRSLWRGEAFDDGAEVAGFFDGAAGGEVEPVFGKAGVDVFFGFPFGVGGGEAGAGEGSPFFGFEEPRVAEAGAAFVHDAFGVAAEIFDEGIEAAQAAGLGRFWRIRGTA